MATAYSPIDPAPAPPTTSTGAPGSALERGPDGPPRVADVVRRARDRGGLERVGHRHEHVIGVRDEHGVRQKAAPSLHRGAEPVGGHRTLVLAVAGAPATARGAVAAGDLKGDAHALARLDVADAVADVDDLRHALMPERERARERRLAGHDQRVEVARGDGQRAHERRAVGVELRGGRLAPGELAGSEVVQLLHGRGVSVTAREEYPPHALWDRSTPERSSRAGSDPPCALLPGRYREGQTALPSK